VLEQIDVVKAALELSIAPLIRSIVVIPLRANGVELGLLIGSSRSLHELDRQQAEVAALFAAQVAATLDATLALGRERRSALTDPLTELLNRRGFEVELERALAAAREDRSPLSLWVLDFDDFKEVNDRAGHEFGDALLREVGHVLMRVLPPGASAGRLGGDEFVVMLPGVDAEEAETVTREVRTQLFDGLDEAGFPLRASIGIASYPFDGGGGSQLVRAADQALYEAKAKGKNCVVGFRELVRDAATGVATTEAASQERRSGAIDASVLTRAGEAAPVLWRETTVQGVVDRLCKALTFTVGATGCLISRVTGPQLVDLAAHALRDVRLAADSIYLIDDFPVTKSVLDGMEPRSISFLDDDLDRAEAFVLRDLEMSCALLMPLVVHGRAWGLVELYDMRLRRYTPEQESVAEFLVGVAGNRIEALGDDGENPAGRTLYRVPDPT
jgi:diguanylate cyclase (GGDEF)-like protein